MSAILSATCSGLKPNAAGTTSILANTVHACKAGWQLLALAELAKHTFNLQATASAWANSDVRDDVT